MVVCIVAVTKSTHTHSLASDHCGLPAWGAVFRGRAGHPDSEGCWQPHPHCHLALQWEEGEGWLLHWGWEGWITDTHHCGAKACWHLHLHCQQQSGQCGGMYQAGGEGRRWGMLPCTRSGEQPSHQGEVWRVCLWPSYTQQWWLCCTISGSIPIYDIFTVPPYQDCCSLLSGFALWGGRSPDNHWQILSKQASKSIPKYHSLWVNVVLTERK